MSRTAGRLRPVWLVDAATETGVDGCVSEATFAERLSQLWLTRPGLSSADVAKALAAGEGPALSAWTIDRLRLGSATNPTLTQVEALAAFFEVTPMYLLGAAAERRLEVDLRRASEVRTARARELLLRIGDLSPAGVAAVSRIIERCVALEGRAG